MLSLEINVFVVDFIFKLKLYEVNTIESGPVPEKSNMIQYILARKKTNSFIFQAFIMSVNIPKTR